VEGSLKGRINPCQPPAMILQAQGSAICSAVKTRIWQRVGFCFVFVLFCFFCFVLFLDCLNLTVGKPGQAKGGGVEMGVQAERWKAEVLHIDDLKLSL